MIDDEKRRASDALIEALREGITLTQILELAMDDIDAEETVTRKLAHYHDQLDERPR